MQIKKVCPNCKRELPLASEYFHKDSLQKDGFRHSCKECNGYDFGIKSERWTEEEDDILRKYYPTTSAQSISDNFLPNRTKEKINDRSNKVLGLRKNKSEWIKEEIEFLIENYPMMRNEDIVQKLQGKTMGQIRGMAKKHDLSKHRDFKKYSNINREPAWNEFELKILKDNYSDTSNAEISNLLPGKTKEQVDRKARDLNLYKSKEYAISRNVKNIFKNSETMEGILSEINPWSKEELELLTTIYPYFTNSDIEKILDSKTTRQIAAKSRRLGLRKSKSGLKDKINSIKKSKTWTEKEINLLKDVYSLNSNNEIVNMLDEKTENQILYMANKIGLKKDDSYIKDTLGLSGTNWNSVKISCIVCGKEFYVNRYKYENNISKYCSLSCRNKHKSETQCGENNPNYNNRWNEEQRKAASIRAVQQLLDMDFKNVETNPERITREILEEMGIEFEKELDCKYYLVDFYLKKYNLMIEVQGDFFHCHPNLTQPNSREDKIKERDVRKNIYLYQEYGIKTLYLWESDLNRKRDLCKFLIGEYIANNGVLLNYHSYNYDLIDGRMLKNKEIIDIGY